VSVLGATLRLQQILLTALLLGLFAVLGTGLVAFTFDNTHERIAANERAALLRNLHVLIPPERHDNDLFNDLIEVTAPELLGTVEPVAVYRARKGGWPVALVIAATAPDGYSGPIRLLVGIDVDGTLAGVRVVSHRETPGLGDAIEASRSDWILGFDGRSLDDPKESLWAVKRDGGHFDQFTGATITPRAVVNAVKKALLYFQRNSDRLFAEPSLREAPAPQSAAAPPTGAQ
jgi:Na+-translocating ferredoxin:NAD+ oxidoreductase subunit G